MMSGHREVQGGHLENGECDGEETAAVIEHVHGANGCGAAQSGHPARAFLRLLDGGLPPDK